MGSIRQDCLLPSTRPVLMWRAAYVSFHQHVAFSSEFQCTMPFKQVQVFLIIKKDKLRTNDHISEVFKLGNSL